MMAVKAVMAAMFERARAIRLAARWAVEKLEFVLVDDVARVATTPNAPATRAPTPAQSPAPDPPKEAPWTSTRIPNTTSTTPVHGVLNKFNFHRDERFASRPFASSFYANNRPHDDVTIIAITRWHCLDIESRRMAAWRFSTVCKPAEKVTQEYDFLSEMFSLLRRFLYSLEKCSPRVSAGKCFSTIIIYW